MNAHLTVREARQPRRMNMRSAERIEADVDPERVYDELIGHARECARCWPWRNALHRGDRLCASGLALLERYERAELIERSADRLHAALTLDAAVLDRSQTPNPSTPLPGLGAVAAVAAASGSLQWVGTTSGVTNG